MVAVRTGPYPALALDPLVTDPPVGRSEGCQLVHDLGGVGIDHGITHGMGHHAEDLPVRLCIAWRRHRLLDPPDPPLAAGERAILLIETGSGKHHVGVFGRLGEEHVLIDQEFEPLQGLLHLAYVALGLGWIVADDIEGLELPFQCLLVHLGLEQSVGDRQGLHPPSLGELLQHLLVVRGLVAGICVGESTHVACALHVVLAPERIDSGMGPAHVSGGQDQVGKGHDTGGAALVLGHSQAVYDHRLPGRGVHPGRLPDKIGGNACNAGDALGRIVLYVLLQGLEVLHSRLDELLVLEPFLKDGVEQRVHEGNVGSRLEPEPYPILLLLGHSRHIGTARIYDDELGAVGYGLFHLEPDYRMGLGGIGTAHHQDVGTYDLLERRRGSPASQCGQQTADRGSVSDPCAVIDVVGADNRACQFLCQIVLFIRTPG